MEKINLKKNIELQIIDIKNIPKIPLFKSKNQTKKDLEIYKHKMFKNPHLIIYVYVVCYNEEFILPYFLKHYDFATKIFIYDNCSSDNSVEIALKDPRCEIIYFNSMFDDNINKNIKNNAWKQHRDECDYCIVVDMDEFMWYPTLYTTLQKYKNKQIIFPLFNVSGINVVSDKPNYNKNDYLYNQIDMGYFNKSYSKKTMFCPYYIYDMNYTDGSHECKPIISYNIRKNPPMIYLLHYKYIGGIERLKKRQNEYSKRISTYNKENNKGCHYFNLNDIELYYKGAIEKSKKINLMNIHFL